MSFDLVVYNGSLVCEDSSSLDLQLYFGSFLYLFSVLDVETVKAQFVRLPLNPFLEAR